MDYATCACWLYSKLCEIKRILVVNFLCEHFFSSLLMFHYKRDILDNVYCRIIINARVVFFDSLCTMGKFGLRIFHDFACLIMINFMRRVFIEKLCVFIKTNFGNFLRSYTRHLCNHVTWAQHSLLSHAMHSLFFLSREKSPRFPSSSSTLDSTSIPKNII